MANSTINPLQGNCFPPFLDAAQFPSTGGFPAGRLCASIDGLPNSPTCCLPCPVTDWVYAESFNTFNSVASWLHVVSIGLLGFMLLSYVCLPVQATRSHYLSICLVVATLFISLGFVVPLAAQPDKCYNEITPNDMYSSLTCAWSGSFIVAGALSAVAWILIRALSMNLQIVWDIVPGQTFFYVALAAGWGVPAAFFAAALVATGVSFRFGDACHVNHKNSMGDFWGPLMGMTLAACLIQLSTFGYCTYIYLKNVLSDDNAPTSTTGSTAGSHLPTQASSNNRAYTARAVWRRLKKVLWLQWRGVCIVTIIMVDVIFFTVVFVYLDQLQDNISRDYQKTLPWLACLIQNPNNREKCLPLVKNWLVSENMVVACLILLSLTGLQLFLLLIRPSIFPAWAEFFSDLFHRRHRTDSISEDAAHPVTMERSTSQRNLIERKSSIRHANTTFEMQKPHLDIHTSQKQIQSEPQTPSTVHDLSYSALEKGGFPAAHLSPTLQHQQPEYFPRPESSASMRERRYIPPSASFSSPGRPSSRNGPQPQQSPAGGNYGRPSSRNGPMTYSQHLNGLRLSPPEEIHERGYDEENHHTR